MLLPEADPHGLLMLKLSSSTFAQLLASEKLWAQVLLRVHLLPYLRSLMVLQRLPATCAAIRRGPPNPLVWQFHQPSAVLYLATVCGLNSAPRLAAISL